MKQSAGILLYRKSGEAIEVLLAHPGGPYWAKKDGGVWSIPKGEIDDHEDLLAAAKREFSEELGQAVPDGTLIDLGSAKQSSGKTVYAWALEADLDVSTITSNTIAIEWPPKSGKRLDIPEIDRAKWFGLSLAIDKIVRGQQPLLKRLAAHLGVEIAESNQATADFENIKQMQTRLF